MKIISKKFYKRNTMIVAQELLGKLLVHKLPIGKMISRIVETEAYCQDDPGSHAYCGKTKRNIPMFGEPGCAYVYFCYGNSWMFNIVTEVKDVAGAVLIRAVEPIKNIELMKTFRNVEMKNLTNGPGKLCQAMNIDKRYNQQKIFSGNLTVQDDNYSCFKIEKSRRIGLKKGVELLARFFIKNNQYVSK